MWKRDTIATSVKAWGWQRHHTVIILCIFSHSISLSMSERVFVCVCRLCIGHLAELCCHFWFWAAALSSNPEYWQGEQSVLTQRKPAVACDSLYPLSYPENGSQCKPGQCRGDKNTLHQMTLQHWAAAHAVQCLHCTGNLKICKGECRHLLGDADLALSMPFVISNAWCICSINLPIPHVLAFLFCVKLKSFLAEYKCAQWVIHKFLPGRVCCCQGYNTSSKVE